MKIVNIMDGIYGVRIQLGQYTCCNHMPTNFTRNMMAELA